MHYERVDELAVMRMDGGKANAIDLPFLESLDRLWGQFEEDDASAAVLTGTGRFFSAGLDLPRVCGFDRATLASFMTSFETVAMRIFRCPRPVVAALNGHAIAGGCVLALQADMRVMAAGKGRIGLNEIRLGLAVPLAAIEALKLTTDAGTAARVLDEGELFDPEQARDLGLVGEVVREEMVLDHAMVNAMAMAAQPEAFAATKTAAREPARERWERQLDAHVEAFVEQWFGEETQRLLAETVEALTAPRQGQGQGQGQGQDQG